jgi:DNA-binding transcriptional LysR family regulator
MEMHQVRYYLAVAGTLNFTRAAEECHLAQPSLTRAIKLLEAELGGDLFRRERPNAQLTDLGQRMHPLLKQCFESATGAKVLATSIKKAEVAALRLALSCTIELELVMPAIMELRRRFKSLELKLLRGRAAEIVDILKDGAAELAIASTIDDGWERIDRWPLFDEAFLLSVSRDHHLANQPTIAFEDLRQERFLIRNYCENAERIATLMRDCDLDLEHSHETSTEQVSTPERRCIGGPE